MNAELVLFLHSFSSSQIVSQAKRGYFPLSLLLVRKLVIEVDFGLRREAEPREKFRGDLMSGRDSQEDINQTANILGTHRANKLTGLWVINIAGIGPIS